ncbi:hypothetical protein NDU88_004601 [Pleurodeles waltl]|uniref:Uncharacterized protein n=1 Tax=Pleurodeles waltl TaxID=8319 RepID=A0AAV7TRU3_PLEWA|nr:hypothetical protein NDU88_004601 [Pleurodeles waltl]
MPPMRHCVSKHAIVNRQVNARFNARGQKDKGIANRPIAVHLLFYGCGANCKPTLVVIPRNWGEHSTMSI